MEQEPKKEPETFVIPGETIIVDNEAAEALRRLGLVDDEEEVKT